MLKFGISKSMLYNWRNMEENLVATQKSRRAFRKGAIANKNLEDRLEAWISENRAKNRAVQIRDIQLKVLELAKEYDEDFQRKFAASNRRAQRFMDRNNLSLRRRTSVGQPLPPDSQTKIANFRSYFRSESRRIPSFRIGNMDEVPVPFDIVSTRTIAAKGSDSVKIHSTGPRKEQLHSRPLRSGVG